VGVRSIEKFCKMRQSRLSTDENDKFKGSKENDTRNFKRKNSYLYNLQCITLSMNIFSLITIRQETLTALKIIRLIFSEKSEIQTSHV
jgi:hypothetical protein